jgi:hypothetical protein
MSPGGVSFDVTVRPQRQLDAVLAALRAPSEPGPVPGEERALAAFRAATSLGSHRCAPPASTPRSLMRRHLKTRRTGVIAIAGGAVLLTAGAASAATGSLPGAAQDAASAALAKVGITVPGTDEHAGTHPDTRGSSGEHAHGAPTGAPETPAGDNSGKGSEISDLATTTDLTGVDKGAAISTDASGGKSQAGQHGQPTDDAAPASGSAPVPAPNDGGTGTADTASDGASSQGTTQAGTSSDGRSGAGSGNAGSHKP